MVRRKINCSIIIVNYKVKQLLFKCISSIYKNSPKSKFEIIVVDNDEGRNNGKELIEKFPDVIYIPNKNKGFGQANNVGAKQAQGEYLFFLNPDTKILSGSIDSLIKLFKKKDVGIIAPILVDDKNNPYKIQGSKILTPIRALFALSIVAKFFPNNWIRKDYYLHSSKRDRDFEADVVPGTAFLIKNKLFNSLGKFDENFFLFFEEFDLCKRLKEMGYKAIISPRLVVSHVWGASTKKSNNINSVFRKSRFNYFKKHYSFHTAFLLEIFLRLSTAHVLILLIIIVGVFLRTFMLHESMVFIGDQGWFYLSARDILIHGEIPLVGIASSHTWIHQGPIWTYMLAIALLIGSFNPLSGAYLTALIDVAAIIFIYKLGSCFFSKKIGLFASLLYAVSPAVISNSRMPYHISPIPLFVLILIFCILKWVKDKNYRYFPLVLFLMSVLYNLHLATVVFWPVIISLLIIGLYKKKSWAIALLRKKYLIFSLLGLLIPMIPVLIYDLQNGFKQTFWYGVWFLYKPLQFVGFFPKVPNENTFSEIGVFFQEFISRLIFIQNNLISTAIFLISIIVAILFLKNNQKSSISIVLLLTLTATLGFFLAKTPSSAYLPMMIPGFLLIIAFAMEKFFGKIKYLSVLIILLISIFNIAFVMHSITSTKDYFGRMKASEKIVKLADGDEYNLIGKGLGSNFKSFTMNYEYLTWWLGKPPAKTNQDLKIIIIDEKPQPRVILKKN